MVFPLIEMELSYKSLRSSSSEALKIQILNTQTFLFGNTSQHWKYRNQHNKYRERRGRDRNGRLVVGGCASFSLPRTTIGQLSWTSSASSSLALSSSSTLSSSLFSLSMKSVFLEQPSDNYHRHHHPQHRHYHCCQPHHHHYSHYL